MTSRPAAGVRRSSSTRSHRLIAATGGLAVRPTGTHPLAAIRVSVPTVSVR